MVVKVKSWWRELESAGLIISRARAEDSELMHACMLGLRLPTPLHAQDPSLLSPDDVRLTTKSNNHNVDEYMHQKGN